MKNQTGQIILLLILVMTVALAIGLSIVQKSLVDVSTASKVEQSSRAFSAAEAGVEKALNSQTNTTCTNCQSFSNNNASIAQILDTSLIPAVPQLYTQQDVFEFPALIAKEDVAQVWLADYTSSQNPPPAVYTQPTLEVYWGNSSTDLAALEVTLVYYDGSSYQSRKWYFDNPSAGRNNGFDVSATCSGNYQFTGGSNTYQCKRILGDSSGNSKDALNNGPLPVNSPNIPVLLRIRLLYNSTSQPFAVRATGQKGIGSCVNGGCWLPSQARSITSTGVSGDTQRRVNLFQLYKVVPPYFDYAIFSAGAITK